MSTCHLIVSFALLRLTWSTLSCLVAEMCCRNTCLALLSLKKIEKLQNQTFLVPWATCDEFTPTEKMSLTANPQEDELFVIISLNCMMIFSLSWQQPNLTLVLNYWTLMSLFPHRNMTDPHIMTWSLYWCMYHDLRSQSEALWCKTLLWNICAYKNADSQMLTAVSLSFFFRHREQIPRVTASERRLAPCCGFVSSCHV